MKKILLSLLFFCASLIVFAQIPQPKKNTYVNDFTGILSAEQISHLNKNIFEIEKKYSVQMAVVLVNNVPKDYDIQDFAVLIGKKWHVGKNQRGLVYVAAIKEHKQRIEVARHLDSIFNNATCLSIMDYMKESFRNKDYAGGLNILIDQINSKLQVSALATEKRSIAASTPDQIQNVAGESKSNEDDTRNTWIGGIFVFSVILIIYLYIRSRKRKRMAMIREMQKNAGNQPGYYNPSQGYDNNSVYGNPGMYGNPPYQQPDHTLRNVAAGAVLGAAAGYAARTIQDHVSDHHQQLQNNNNLSQDNSMLGSGDNDNKPSNWGDWGSSDNSDSSDTGFSDDSSSDSDSGGATSDW